MVVGGCDYVDARVASQQQQTQQAREKRRVRCVGFTLHAYLASALALLSAANKLSRSSAPFTLMRYLVNTCLEASAGSTSTHVMST